jgi:LPS-assembly protein
MVVTTARPTLLDCGWWRVATRVAAIGLLAITSLVAEGITSAPSAFAQRGSILAFPARPKPVQPGSGLLSAKSKKDQMLVRATEMDYDYTNERVSAVGNVQIYYSGSTLEADRVIYDQKTKRLHAEGNVKLTEANGNIVYSQILDLSDDFRDGFVDSLRIDGPEQTRFAASRAERTSGEVTVFQSGVYTACEPCKDDPTKPPKWQIKAARIIHDQGEKMMYFEDVQFEFFGVPLAYLPYFSSPDPSAKRKSGFLVPTYHTSSVYGFGVTTPYYFALAPDYDLTITPMITSKQGPLVQAEWRQRLINGSYMVRASGIFQLDKQAFFNSGDLSGFRDVRGHVESAGQFRLNDKWVYGWDGTLVTDRAYFQDYGLLKRVQTTNLLATTPDYVLSQAYLQGRGEKSFFDMRAMYFYGFSSQDSQRQIPIIHPVIDHYYVAKDPFFGGELSLRSNLTSLSREAAFFDPINANATVNGLCSISNADPAVKTLNNCLLRGVPGEYTRFSTEVGWRRTVVDQYGQMWTPFASVRADLANVQINNDPGVSNYMQTGDHDVARVMPTVGLEYRYPFISVQSWGTQTIEPIAQIIARPNETGIGRFPNESSQSLNFDVSNLFSQNKYAGWDRVEGGGRLNAGVNYTAQFNRGGFVNVMFGQSYSLFGQNSFAVGGPTNTGIESGLDTTRSDYVARVAYQPNSTFTLTSRFRMNEADFTLARSEFEAAANFDRWTTSLIYGNYAAQPALGFLERREGLVGSAKFKINPNWLVLGALRYDLRAEQLTETQVGLGYIDDCLILALNYITEFNYNVAGTTTTTTTTAGTPPKHNQTLMLQLTLRTLGGSSASTGVTGLGSSSTGLPK